MVQKSLQLVRVPLYRTSMSRNFVPALYASRWLWGRKCNAAHVYQTVLVYDKFGMK